ncbi:hypothetical protein ONS95_004089 [Cadophora gregata]|uniref:uncharacterized protein n=1 Tax=Cadophora gregata TaxID=51156 RepID=UPI0026DB2833|nr:uncharacterized protein ONS95_004089 [Cadophora gregata]KAK0105553.1 hypothetical protein ONS96_004938 [Cadophora gregata f. sp. sojae]KAK0105556.1 hypothetical protein ONS95_004089 [Cadophora gregata]
MELPELTGEWTMGNFFHDGKLMWTPFVTRESAEKPKDLSASIIQDLTNLGTVRYNKGNDVAVTQFNTGTAELKERTKLYIISRKGVFAVLYWESVSFEPDDEWLAADQVWTSPAKQKTFKTTVLDLLKNGSKYHPELKRKLLEDEHIKAYLIGWREEGASGTGYESQWTQMKDMVASIIPTLTDDRWCGDQIHTSQGQGRLENRYKADEKNVFKYDSQHPVAGTDETLHKEALWVKCE